MIRIKAEYFSIGPCKHSSLISKFHSPWNFSLFSDVCLDLANTTAFLSGCSRQHESFNMSFLQFDRPLTTKHKQLFILQLCLVNVVPDIILHILFY